MVKTDGAQLKAQTYFEQVPLDVVEKVFGREAVRTHVGTKRLRETAAGTKPHSRRGSIAKAAIKSKGAGWPP
jgi:hypothetical protein